MEHEMEHEDDRLFSTSKIARWLGVSRRTALRYLEAGLIRSVCVNGRRKATRRAVMEFLDQEFQRVMEKKP